MYVNKGRVKMKRFLIADLHLRHVRANRILMDEYDNCMCMLAKRIDYRPIDLDVCLL